MDAEKIKQFVREQYGKIGAEGSSAVGCCGPSSAAGCCGPSPADAMSSKVGYSKEELDAVPDGANLGLGCGNPQAIANLKPGETVVDLGSGGGLDCFLAAKQVGASGRVIGVDMTPEMLSRARENAKKADADNVEFRLGEIEHLPVADQSVDVIISNCVINISTDKLAVYKEALRVLKPGGRLAISDVLASAPLPESVLNNAAMYSGCLAGAATVEELETTLKDAGFGEIRIEPNEDSRMFIRDWAPDTDLETYVVAAYVEAVRP